MDATEKLLAAIESVQAGVNERLDVFEGKVDRQFAELRRADGHIAEEVQRMGRKVERLEQDFRDLKSDTTRTIGDERRASADAMQAIIRHVDESSKAFKEKAAKIDAFETELSDVKTSMTKLADQTALVVSLLSGISSSLTRWSNHWTVKVAIVVGAAAYGWWVKH